MDDTLIQIHQGINDILELNREIQAIILGIGSYEDILERFGYRVNFGRTAEIKLLYGYPVKIFPPIILPEKYIGFRLKSLF